MAKTLQLWPAVFIYSPGALQPSFLSLNKTAEGKAAEKERMREKENERERMRERKSKRNRLIW